LWFLFRSTGTEEPGANPHLKDDTIFFVIDRIRRFSYGYPKSEKLLKLNGTSFLMLDDVINTHKLDKYIVTFEVGQTLFLEGDDSQDLYILVDGKAGILKGTKRIAEISGRGSVFGEMSFLLGENRTATVKALTDLKVIKIPKEEIPNFLTQFPEVVREFARYLAKRLEETSQIVYGLKEFCDQLPDAVILTDKDGKILSCNRAAENLYGREEDQMRYKSAEEIYEDPAAYKRFLEEVTSQRGDTAYFHKHNRPL
jgi:PAS domain-containing protein